MQTTTKTIRVALFCLNLQLFGEGGGAAGTGAPGGETGVTAGAPGLQTTRSTNNPLADVQYGKQAAYDDGMQNAAPDREAEFETLIKGDFKEQYDKRVSDTVQKRLKSSKDTVEKYEKLGPVLEMLGAKYGVDSGNVEALTAAIEQDDSYYEDEALEKGISVQQLKEIKKMERENSQLRAAMEDRQRQQQAEQDVAKWMKEAEAAQQVFPDLDLRAELENPQFIGLLQRGINLETAYFAIHHRELVPQAMQYASRQTEQQVVNKVRANGARPSENGLHNVSSAITKSDVSTLSKQDMAEIRRRVARGEKISF